MALGGGRGEIVYDRGAREDLGVGGGLYGDGGEGEDEEGLDLVQFMKWNIFVLVLSCEMEIYFALILCACSFPNTR